MYKIKNKLELVLYWYGMSFITFYFQFFLWTKNYYYEILNYNILRHLLLRYLIHIGTLKAFNIYIL